MKKSLLFKFLLLFVITANAQFVPKMVQEDNEAIRSLRENVAPEGWLYFKRRISKINAYI